MNFIKSGVILLAGLAVTSCGEEKPETSPNALLETPQGPIQGVATEDAGIYTFNGIPFAAPPVDNLRWAAPESAPNWIETREAAQFGNRCMQPALTEDGFMNRLLEGQGFGAIKTWFVKRVVASQEPAPMSEDCLYLNVRTGNVSGEEKKPVMVWIHGGAHQFGSGDTSFYQSNGLVKKDVVLVTINYRLGVFGYMAHPALSEVDPNGVSGNYGTLDQMAALKWVRENISAYGGDPKNVTIFGESAGAWSVTELMASPLAKGLFDKAIAQSGASTYHLGQISGKGAGWPSGYFMGRKVAQSVGLSEPSASELRAVPAKKIMENLPNGSDEAFHHIRDGYVFPKNVGEAFRSGDINSVPFMAGYNADEATLFFPDDPEPSVWLEDFPRQDSEAQISKLNVVYPGQGKTLQALYNLDEEYVKGGTQMMGDDIFGVNIRYAASRNEALSSPSYVYFFSRIPSSDSQTLGAYHSAEIPFVFGALREGFGYTDEDKHLSEIMTSFWTNFAKTGNPNSERLPHWDRHQDRIWMELSANVGDSQTGMKTEVRQHKIDALETGLLKKLRELEGVNPQTSPSIGAVD